MGDPAVSIIKPDRKGAGILLLATVWALVGIAVGAGLSGSNVNVPHTHIPLAIRTSLWLGSAALGLVAVWAKSLRGIALAALVFPVTVRIVSYLWALLAAVIPGGPPGYTGAWYPITLHLAMVGFVVYVAYERDDRAEVEAAEVLA